MTVSVVPVVELVGLSVALVRAGTPVTENVTVLLNPLTLLIVIAELAVCRAEIVRLAGFAVRLKSGGLTDCTTSVTVVLWTSDPLVPVTVNV